MLFEAKFLKKSTFRMKSSFCVLYGDCIGYDPLTKDNYLLTNIVLIKMITAELFKAFQGMYMRVFPLFQWILSVYYLPWKQIHVQNYLPKQIQQIQIAVKLDVNSYIIYQT